MQPLAEGEIHAYTTVPCVRTPVHGKPESYKLRNQRPETGLSGWLGNQDGKYLKAAITEKRIKTPKCESEIPYNLRPQAGQELHWIQGQIPVNCCRAESAEQVFQQLPTQASPEFKLQALPGQSNVANTLGFPWKLEKGHIPGLSIFHKTEDKNKTDPANKANNQTSRSLRCSVNNITIS